MKNILFPSFVLLLLLSGCKNASTNNLGHNYVKEENTDSGTLVTKPETARIAAENEEYILFLNNEPDPNYDSEDPSGARRVSLWIYDKTTGKYDNPLVTNPGASVEWWYNIKETTQVSFDRIRTISKVVILNKPGEPLTILAQGNGPTTALSVQSFIIDIKKRTALCLPTDLELQRITPKGHLQMLSSRYHKENGRYEITEYFDITGKRIE